MIHHGDCIEVMAAMEPESVDAIVTDPPYGLEFMGKEWDRLGDDPVSKSWDTKGRNENKPRRVASCAGGRHAVSYKQINPRCRNCGRAVNGRDTAKGFKVCSCDKPDWYQPNTFGVRQQEWHARWAAEALRVAKPSAYLLAFGGTRTVHRMTVALEDAGWIIRDMLVWAYASGFPKSKASLKPAWEPIVMARKPGPLRMLAIDECRIPGTKPLMEAIDSEKRDKRILHTRSATGTGEMSTEGRWPANVILTDPIFDGGVEGVVGGGIATTHPGTMRNDAAGNNWFGPDRVAGTVLSDGDSGTYSRFFQLPRRYNETCQECGRVSSAEPPSSLPSPSAGSAPSHAQTGAFSDSDTTTGSLTTSGIAIASLSDDAANMPSILRSRQLATSPESGRPSSPAKSPDAASPETGTTTTTAVPWTCGTCAEATTLAITSPSPESRSYPFAFLIPKADRSDREPVLGGLPEQPRQAKYGSVQDGRPHTPEGYVYDRKARANVHPTVKPTELMRHLVRLVTPVGGTVLDPFLGSGTTGLACELEGFPWIGIEKEAEYVAIAEARLNGTQRGLGLSA